MLDERPAHRRGHQPGEDRAGRADQRARDEQQRVAEHVAAGRDREAGERVEQRDHDRHVRAADRQHEQHADERARSDDEQPPAVVARRRLPRWRSADRSEPDGRDERRRRTGPARPGSSTGRVVISSCSLANVTTEPAEATTAPITHA